MNNIKSYTADQSYGHANNYTCHFCGTTDDKTYWHTNSHLSCTACKDKIEALGPEEGAKWITEVITALVIAEALIGEVLDTYDFVETIWPDSEPVELDEYDAPEPPTPTR